MMRWSLPRREPWSFTNLLLAAGIAVLISPPPLFASNSGSLFDATYSHYVVGDPQDMATGDFNGDGHLDVALAEEKERRLKICLGDGNGRFNVLAGLTTGHRQACVAAGDLDGDGNLDLVLSHFTPDYYDSDYFGLLYANIVPLLGNGNGTFTEGEDLFEQDHLSRHIALGDLNGDSILDLVVVMLTDNELAILFGHGDGTFSSPVYQPTGNGPNSTGLADLDWDGDTDLIVTNGWDDSISVLLNDGGGNFLVDHEYTVGNGPHSITITDLDQAGGLDVAVTNYNDPTISVLLGSGTGSFSAPVSYSSVGHGKTIAAGDINGDGHVDLVVGSDTTSRLAVKINTGSGDFSEGITLETSQDTADLAIADLDGDGGQDLCLATSGIAYAWGNFGRLSVLMNFGDGSFPEPKRQAIGHKPDALDLVDLNEDGVPDLATIAGSKLRVLLGIGDTTFGTPTEYDGVGNLNDLVTGDLNGDDHLDVAAVSISATSVFIGDGDGSLTFAGSVDVGSRALHIADLNLDGNLDLIDDYLHILLGNGDGTFEVLGFPSVYDDAPPDRVAVGDLNEDDIPDLALRYEYYVSNEEFSAVDVWLGNGDGTFTSGSTYELGRYLGSLQILDLDLDGFQDLVAANQSVYIPPYEYGSGIRVTVRWGRGDGTFDSGPQFVCGVDPTAIHTDDLNGDGRPDLAVTGARSRNVAVILNQGNRQFERGLSFTCGVDPQCLDTADLDGDGDVELVTGNGSGVSILLNSSIFPFVVTGPGRGEDNPPLVRLCDLSLDGTTRRQWQAYGVSRYGVNVACADLDGDYRSEILTGAGPGEMFGPHVRGFLASGDPIPGLSYLAYGTNRYGVNVAGADLDGDGRYEILTGAGPGVEFGPHVRGWQWDGSAVSPIPGISYFAYGTPKWGVNVAGCDIDGDGFDEIITGAGPGSVYGPHVRGWDWDGGDIIAPIQPVSFLAYGTHRSGVNVAGGDIDGDGIDEIVTGAGPSYWFSPNVRGWNWDGSGSVTMIPGLDFFAYGTGHWGVNVACGDLDGDGIDEIATGPGPGIGLSAHVRGWNYDGIILSSIPEVDFNAYDPAVVRHGVKVAAGRAGRIPTN